MTLKPFISIITPAFNEEKSLSIYYERMFEVLKSLDVNYEWMVVDDHSSDSTYRVLKNIAGKDKNVRGVRLSRNYGSHKAINAGLHLATGDCAIVMASDLQDPPEIIPELINTWKRGIQIVWAVRSVREGETNVTKGLSRLYYWLMKRVVGVEDLPSTGADFFLIDRKVIEALKLFKESNVSIFSLLSWMGFKQDRISYVKQARIHGKSGWTFRKKMKLVIDSITSFSHFPIRLMTYIGCIAAFSGFAYALFVIYNFVSGYPDTGWSSLMVVVLILGGFQLIMAGILGQYLWRAVDESRRRPQFLIESSTEKD
jgi:dolichol-phosphate mannosyltransferase